MQANRNSHTTSTKCQYQAQNSKPRCCCGVKWPKTQCLACHVFSPHEAWYHDPEPDPGEAKAAE